MRRGQTSTSSHQWWSHVLEASGVVDAEKRALELPLEEADFAGDARSSVSDGEVDASTAHEVIRASIQLAMSATAGLEPLCRAIEHQTQALLSRRLGAPLHTSVFLLDEGGTAGIPFELGGRHLDASRKVPFAGTSSSLSRLLSEGSGYRGGESTHPVPHDVAVLQGRAEVATFFAEQSRPLSSLPSAADVAFVIVARTAFGEAMGWIEAVGTTSPHGEGESKEQDLDEELDIARLLARQAASLICLCRQRDTDASKQGEQASRLQALLSELSVASALATSSRWGLAQCLSAMDSLLQSATAPLGSFVTALLGCHFAMWRDFSDLGEGQGPWRWTWRASVKARDPAMVALLTTALGTPTSVPPGVKVPWYSISMLVGDTTSGNVLSGWQQSPPVESDDESSSDATSASTDEPVEDEPAASSVFWDTIVGSSVCRHSLSRLELPGGESETSCVMQIQRQQKRWASPTSSKAGSTLSADEEDEDDRDEDVVEVPHGTLVCRRIALPDASKWLPFEASLHSSVEHSALGVLSEEACQELQWSSGSGSGVAVERRSLKQWKQWRNRLQGVLPAGVVILPLPRRSSLWDRVWMCLSPVRDAPGSGMDLEAPGCRARLDELAAATADTLARCCLSELASSRGKRQDEELLEARVGALKLALTPCPAPTAHGGIHPSGRRASLFEDLGQGMSRLDMSQVLEGGAAGMSGEPRVTLMEIMRDRADPRTFAERVTWLLQETSRMLGHFLGGDCKVVMSLVRVGEAQAAAARSAAAAGVHPGRMAAGGARSFFSHAAGDVPPSPTLALHALTLMGVAAGSDTLGETGLSLAATELGGAVWGYCAASEVVGEAGLILEASLWDGFTPDEQVAAEASGHTGRLAVMASVTGPRDSAHGKIEHSMTKILPEIASRGAAFAAELALQWEGSALRPLAEVSRLVGQIGDARTAKDVVQVALKAMVTATGCDVADIVLVLPASLACSVGLSTEREGTALLSLAKLVDAELMDGLACSLADAGEVGAHEDSPVWMALESAQVVVLAPSGRTVAGEVGGPDDPLHGRWGAIVPVLAGPGAVARVADAVRSNEGDSDSSDVPEHCWTFRDGDLLWRSLLRGEAVGEEDSSLTGVWDDEPGQVLDESTLPSVGACAVCARSQAWTPTAGDENALRIVGASVLRGLSRVGRELRQALAARRWAKGVEEACKGREEDAETRADASSQDALRSHAEAAGARAAAVGARAEADAAIQARDAARQNAVDERQRADEAIRSAREQCDASIRSATAELHALEDALRAEMDAVRAQAAAAEDAAHATVEAMREELESARTQTYADAEELIAAARAEAEEVVRSAQAEAAAAVRAVEEEAQREMENVEKECEVRVAEAEKDADARVKQAVAEATKAAAEEVHRIRRESAAAATVQIAAERNKAKAELEQSRAEAVALSAASELEKQEALARARSAEAELERAREAASTAAVKYDEVMARPFDAASVASGLSVKASRYGSVTPTRLSTRKSFVGVGQRRLSRALSRFLAGDDGSSPWSSFAKLHTPRAADDEGSGDEAVELVKSPSQLSIMSPARRSLGQSFASGRSVGRSPSNLTVVKDAKLEAEAARKAVEAAEARVRASQLAEVTAKHEVSVAQERARSAEARATAAESETAQTRERAARLEAALRALRSELSMVQTMDHLNKTGASSSEVQVRTSIRRIETAVSSALEEAAKRASTPSAAVREEPKRALAPEQPVAQGLTKLTSRLWGQGEIDAEVEASDSSDESEGGAEPGLPSPEPVAAAISKGTIIAPLFSKSSFVPSIGALAADGRSSVEETLALLLSLPSGCVGAALWTPWGMQTHSNTSVVVELQLTSAVELERGVPVALSVRTRLASLPTVRAVVAKDGEVSDRGLISNAFASMAPVCAPRLAADGRLNPGSDIPSSGLFGSLPRAASAVFVPVMAPLSSCDAAAMKMSDKYSFMVLSPPDAPKRAGGDTPLRPAVSSVCVAVVATYWSNEVPEDHLQMFAQVASSLGSLCLADRLVASWAETAQREATWLAVQAPAPVRVVGPQPLAVSEAGSSSSLRLSMPPPLLVSPRISRTVHACWEAARNCARLRMTLAPLQAELACLRMLGTVQSLFATALSTARTASGVASVVASLLPAVLAATAEVSSAARGAQQARVSLDASAPAAMGGSERGLLAARSSLFVVPGTSTGFGSGTAMLGSKDARGSRNPWSIVPEFATGGTARTKPVWSGDAAPRVVSPRDKGLVGAVVASGRAIRSGVVGVTLPAPTTEEAASLGCDEEALAQASVAAWPVIVHTAHDGGAAVVGVILAALWPHSNQSELAPRSSSDSPRRVVFAHDPGQAPPPRKIQRQPTSGNLLKVAPSGSSQSDAAATESPKFTPPPASASPRRSALRRTGSRHTMAGTSPLAAASPLQRSATANLLLARVSPSHEDEAWGTPKIRVPEEERSITPPVATDASPPELEAAVAEFGRDASEALDRGASLVADQLEAVLRACGIMALAASAHADTYSLSVSTRGALSKELERQAGALVRGAPSKTMLSLLPQTSSSLAASPRSVSLSVLGGLILRGLRSGGERLTDTESIAFTVTGIVPTETSALYYSLYDQAARHECEFACRWVTHGDDALTSGEARCLRAVLEPEGDEDCLVREDSCAVLAAGSTLVCGLMCQESGGLIVSVGLHRTETAEMEAAACALATTVLQWFVAFRESIVQRSLQDMTTAAEARVEELRAVAEEQEQERVRDHAVATLLAAIRGTARVEDATNCVLEADLSELGGTAAVVWVGDEHSLSACGGDARPLPMGEGLAGTAAAAALSGGRSPVEVFVDCASKDGRVHPIERRSMGSDPALVDRAWYTVALGVGSLLTAERAGVVCVQVVLAEDSPRVRTRVQSLVAALADAFSRAHSAQEFDARTKELLLAMQQSTEALKSKSEDEESLQLATRELANLARMASALQELTVTGMQLAGQVSGSRPLEEARPSVPLGGSMALVSRESEEERLVKSVRSLGSKLPVWLLRLMRAVGVQGPHAAGCRVARLWVPEDATPWRLLEQSAEPQHVNDTVWVTIDWASESAGEELRLSDLHEGGVPMLRKEGSTSLLGDAARARGGMLLDSNRLAVAIMEEPPLDAVAAATSLVGMLGQQVFEEQQAVDAWGRASSAGRRLLGVIPEKMRASASVASGGGRVLAVLEFAGVPLIDSAWIASPADMHESLEAVPPLSVAGMCLCVSGVSQAIVGRRASVALAQQREALKAATKHLGMLTSSASIVTATRERIEAAEARAAQAGAEYDRCRAALRVLDRSARLTRKLLASTPSDSSNVVDEVSRQGLSDACSRLARHCFPRTLVARVILFGPSEKRSSRVIAVGTCHRSLKESHRRVALTDLVSFDAMQPTAPSLASLAAVEECARRASIVRVAPLVSPTSASELQLSQPAVLCAPLLAPVSGDSKTGVVIGVLQLIGPSSVLNSTDFAGDDDGDDVSIRKGSHVPSAFDDGDARAAEEAAAVMGAYLRWSSTQASLFNLSSRADEAISKLASSLREGGEGEQHREELLSRAVESLARARARAEDAKHREKEALSRAAWAAGALGEETKRRDEAERRSASLEEQLLVSQKKASKATERNDRLKEQLSRLVDVGGADPSWFLGAGYGEEGDAPSGDEGTSPPRPKRDRHVLESSLSEARSSLDRLARLDRSLRKSHK
jgi:hypothetical protein